MSASEKARNAVNEQARSKKEGWVYAILLLFFGYTGVHRFYIGKIGIGIAYLFTFGFFGIGVLVDVIVLLSNGVRDAEYAVVQIDKGARVFVTLIFAAIIFFSLIGFVIFGATKATFNYWAKEWASENYIKSLRIEVTTEDGKTTRTIKTILGANPKAGTK